MTILLLTAAPGSFAAAAGTPNQGLVALQDALSGAIAAARGAVVAIRARHPSPGRVQIERAGAGVIVDPRGIIITNYHLVEGAHEVEVKVWQSGSPRYFAWIMATSPVHDLAVIALWGTGPFPRATLANSDLVQVGDRVVAVGTPFGLPHSASTGIVSGLKLDLRVGEQLYPDMIQTDATINQGNSGGALVNLRGEVIGLVTAIFAPQGSSTGVAFAIPSNRVREFVSRVARIPGAQLAAFQQEPIRIGQRRPHGFADCTTCHPITSKLPISMAQDIPHPDAGDCMNCHVITDMAQTGGATVAWQLPLGAGLTPAGALGNKVRAFPVVMIGIGCVLVLGFLALLGRAARGGKR